MSAMPVIWRSRRWRVASGLLVVLMIACVVGGKLLPDSTSRPSSIPEVTARVYATSAEGGAIEIDRVAHGDLGSPPPGEIVVQYVGVRSADWDGPFHRREMVYWSCHHISLPDGTELRPDDPRAPPGLLLAADAAFQGTLAPGTAYFGWVNGVTTWREHRVVTDLGHAASVGAYWLLYAGLLVLCASCVAIAVAEIRASRRVVCGRCWRCGYDRAGLESPDPCPECGDRPAGGATRPPAPR